MTNNISSNNKLLEQLAVPLRYFKMVLYTKDKNQYKELSNLSINNKITFNINNTVSGAMSEANIVISGLRVDTMSFLATTFTPFNNDKRSKMFDNKIELYAGYTTSKTTLLFKGNIIEATPNFDNADYSITLKAMGSYSVLLNSLKNYSFDGEKDLSFILQQIKEDLGYIFINELEEEHRINNYTYKNTSIIDHLRNLSQLTNTNIFIDRDILIAMEKDKSLKKYKNEIISKNDIIGAVRPNVLGCELDVRMNPSYRTSQEIQIESDRFPQLNKNNYVIQTIGHSGDTMGDNWKTTITLKKRININSNFTISKNIQMSNIPNYDKTALTDELSAFNYIIGNYLNNNLFTINIVKIKTIKENSVDVIPVIQQKTADNSIVELTNDSIIHNVPVLFLSGGNCSISFKLNEDDYGFLFTTKDDSNNFIKTLQTSEIGSYKQFNLNSSFFIPFQIMNIKSSIIIKNNTSQVEITENEINITAENINIIGNSNINGDVNVNGNLTTKETTKSKELIAENGATGTFVDSGVGASGLTLIISNGIITGIE